MSTTPASRHRPHRSVIDGLRLVAEFHQSNLSQAAFARDRGLSEKAVSYWVRRVRTLQAATQATPVATGSLVHVADVDHGGQVVPLAPPREPDSKPIVARVPAGVGIEVRCGGRSLLVGPGFDRALLRELIRELEGLPVC